MTFQPDKEFKYILHIKDHFSKFSWGYSLKSKSAEEIAFNLFEQFMIFGIPKILQTDNGTEFTSSVIKQLINLWPEIKIINGRPRHPQSQGLIEKGNDILQVK